MNTIFIELSALLRIIGGCFCERGIISIFQIQIQHKKVGKTETETKTKYELSH